MLRFRSCAAATLPRVLSSSSGHIAALPAVAASHTSVFRLSHRTPFSSSFVQPSPLLRSFHSGVARAGPDDPPDSVDDLPDYNGDGPEDDFGDHEPEEEDRGAARAALKEQQQAARQLGVGGPMSKQDRFAASVKRKRAQKAASEEQKHEKARLEKAKEKARKAAAAKLSAGDLDAAEVEADAADADAAKVPAVELDKKTAKEVQKKIAELVPKGDAGKKLSPAAIAAAAAAAKKIREEAMRAAAIVRVNDKVDGTRIIVIDAKGTKLGEMSRAEAFRTAKAAGLDLLQVSPPGLGKDVPVACKLVDYKVYKMQQDKREREEARSKRLTHREVKNVQVKGKIASGDLNTKIDRMKRFLDLGHPVRLSYFSKSPDPLIFVPLFEKCVDALLLDGSIEPGALSASRPYLSFAPIGEKKRSTMFPKLTPEQRERFGVYVEEKTGVWRQRGRKTEEEREKAQEDDEEEEEDEDEEDEDEAEAPKASAPASTAAKSNAPASSASKPASSPASSPTTPVLSASDLKKQKQQEKKKQKYVSGPQLFSKAALQNLKKEGKLSE